MSETPRCDEARLSIQNGLDGPIDAAERASLDLHLAECAECRAYRDGLQGVQAALRALPELTLPDDALEAVWDRTTRAEAPSRVRVWVYGWRGLAAAAVLTGVLIGLWAWVGNDPIVNGGTLAETQVTPGELTEEEIELAAEQVRLVLGLTGSALRRAEHAAVDQVLGGEVAPALKRLPIQLSRSKEPRRSGT
jgi:predicted anti-sigma-YlaC factor YlaD